MCSEEGSLWKGTCGEGMAHLAGVVGDEAPECGRREQALDAMLRLRCFKQG